ncbi:hypothetical protein TELCIR_11324 [Teladorsagia circumcincta]|uniref:Uncharacterized protein n=1 Tax=Teladorsagia circumcincta TaxID=45464 RepID=A0A2G9U9P9_TELCI|nr:hypothetical protein TELCIR_11324 [Teladorsagia circumcincta]
MDFIKDDHLKWNSKMADDAQQMVNTGIKQPYHHGVFSTREFRGTQPTVEEKIRQTLKQNYQQVTGHLSTTIDFGCGCVRSPSTNYDFMKILCVDLTHPNG